MENIYILVQIASLSLNLMRSVHDLRLVSVFSIVHMNIYMYVYIYTYTIHAHMNATCVNQSFVYVNHNNSHSDITGITFDMCESPLKI